MQVLYGPSTILRGSSNMVSFAKTTLVIHIFVLNFTISIRNVLMMNSLYPI